MHNLSWSGGESPEHSILNESNLQARGAGQEDLFSRAREVRNRQVGRQVFVRAVLEVSNFCRQNCSYCGMRRDNRTLERYRLDRERLREVIFEGLPHSVTDLNIQTGEDVIAAREVVLPLVREIATQTKLGISLCLGTLPPSFYDELQEAGAGYYVIKIETGNAQHYGQLQAPGTLEKRLTAIHHLADKGWHVSSGYICGLPGQSAADRVQTMQLLSGLPLAGVSVSPFIPGAETPTAGAEEGNVQEALNSLAMLRLANPRRIIPAVSAFNILDHTGYVRALQAGANLVTINLTPAVERGKYLLYRQDRQIMTEQRVLDAIDAAGGEISSQSMIEWLRESTLPAA